nr:transposase, MuDR [Tanacetum cinerariifolium]
MRGKYDETLFSLKIHHGGFFTEPLGRCYTNGTFNYVELVDVDLFSVIELQEMLKTLGYKNKKNKMYYHFKIPNNNLDHGLQALGNDADVMNLVSESNEEDVNEDENGNESNKEAANEDETDSESSESDDSEDSDYIVDEDNVINVINEVDVDMQEFYQNIDKDVEWVGRCKGNVEVPAQVDVEECYDLDDFDMDIDCDSDVKSSKERKRALRALRKVSKNKHGHFYVGQEFADKKKATTLVTCQAVATRRQLYVWKNDKVRVRAVCREKCPNSVELNVSGLNSPNKGKLKQVNRKWVKSKTVETSCSGHGVNKMDGIRIKV